MLDRVVLTYRLYLEPPDHSISKAPLDPTENPDHLAETYKDQHPGLNASDKNLGSARVAGCEGTMSGRW